MAEVVGKLVNVLGEELVGVVEAVVEVGDLVKGEALEVLLVSVAGQPGAERDGEAVDGELEHAVDDGHGPHHQAKLDHGLAHKLALVARDDGLDHLAVERREPYVQPRAPEQDDRERHQKAKLPAVHGRNADGQQLAQLLQELCVDTDPLPLWRAKTSSLSDAAQTQVKKYLLPLRGHSYRPAAVAAAAADVAYGPRAA